MTKILADALVPIGDFKNWRREWDCICRKFQNHIKNAKSIYRPAIAVIYISSAVKCNEV
jgi:hypothetical protein